MSDCYILTSKASLLKIFELNVFCVTHVGETYLAYVLKVEPLFLYTLKVN